MSTTQPVAKRSTWTKALSDPLVARRCHARASLYAVLTILMFVPGCNRSSGQLVLPLTSGDVARPTYINFIDSAVIDSTRLALVWVDKSDDGDRVWTSSVECDPSGKLRPASPTTLVDTGSIMDAHVFADGESYGIIYSKDSQLVCRRPWNTSSWFPFSPSRPSPRASAAIVDRRGSLIIVALVIQSRAEDVDHTWVAVAAAPDSTRASVLGQMRVPRLREQPSPQLSLVGDSVGVAILQSWGRYESRVAPLDSVGMANGERGAFVLQRLVMDRDRAIEAVPVRAATLPKNSDLSFARSFVLIDSMGSRIAVSSTRAHLVSPFEPTRSLHLISSPNGSGVNYSGPRLQATALRNGRRLVAWVDMPSGQILTNPLDGTVPSEFGGNILACLVTNGEVEEWNVPSFPVVTYAQCIALQRLGGHTVLAWARASARLGSNQKLPNGICLRVLSEIQ